jgi:hypothetical protein
MAYLAGQEVEVDGDDQRYLHDALGQERRDAQVDPVRVVHIDLAQLCVHTTCPRATDNTTTSDTCDRRTTERRACTISLGMSVVQARMPLNMSFMLWPRSKSSRINGPCTHACRWVRRRQPEASSCVSHKGMHELVPTPGDGALSRACRPVSS